MTRGSCVACDVTGLRKRLGHCGRSSAAGAHDDDAGVARRPGADRGVRGAGARSPIIAPAALTVVAPSGYRVEGLDLLTTVALLRALE